MMRNSIRIHDNEITTIRDVVGPAGLPVDLRREVHAFDDVGNSRRRRPEEKRTGMRQRGQTEVRAGEKSMPLVVTRTSPLGSHVVIVDRSRSPSVCIVLLVSECVISENLKVESVTNLFAETN